MNNLPFAHASGASCPWHPPSDPPGYCALDVEGGPMPIPGDEGSIYLGGQVIWPGIAPACGSD